MSYKYESNTSTVGKRNLSCYSKLKNTSRFQCQASCFSGKNAFSERSVMDKMQYNQSVQGGHSGGEAKPIKKCY
jgi:hypothetical protein